MGLASVLRSAVAAASAVTADLQQTVSHRAYTATTDGYGAPTRAAAVSRQALVEYVSRPVRSADGRERVSRAKLTFLGNVPVDVRDLLTLADGTTGPILEVTTPADPAGGGFVTEVWLG